MTVSQLPTGCDASAKPPAQSGPAQDNDDEATLGSASRMGSLTWSMDLGGELRPSLYPLIGALIVAATVLGGSPSTLPPGDQMAYAVLVLVLAGTAFLIALRQEQAGRISAVAATAIAIFLLVAWLQVPGATALLSVPIIAAAALLGLAPATLAALGLTGALWATDPGRAGNVVSTVAIWSSLGLMAAIYRPIQRSLISWQERLERSQQLLEETRDRRAELKEALQQLAEANLQLTRMNHLAQGLRQEAEDARRAKEHFVANVSHELRTPLNMIIGFSEMIVETPQTYGHIPPALLADLTVVLRNSQHLSSLIDDVLDLSQIGGGRMVLSRKEVSLPQIIEAALVAVRPLYDSKGLSLTAELAPDVPPVFCDPARIRGVLLNLVSNAGRLTERGGVHIRVWREEGDVVFSVADTGPGIAEHDRERLFQPFQQLEHSTRREHSGSGLGLSISKSFVELHGGRMWLDSTLGIGSVFYFRLPISAPEQTTRNVMRWFNPHSPYQERVRRRIVQPPRLRPRFIVVEEGDTLQRLLGRHLDGAEIVSKTSLEAASQELARTPATAVVVNRSGLSQTMQQIRSCRLPYGTPAIVCSVPSAQETARSSAVAGYLVKPVSRNRLLATLGNLQLKGNTILIVDDEPGVLRLFQRILRSAPAHYRVLEATNAQYALNILKAEKPDAILLDLAMPVMDGFHFLEQRSQDPALGEIPVVIVSARDPAGQPIVSEGLGLIRGDGLSVPQLIACIEALTGILGTAGLSGDPAPPGTPPETPACERGSPRPGQEPDPPGAG